MLRRVRVRIALATGLCALLAACGNSSAGTRHGNDVYKVVVTGGVSSPGVLGANAKTSINAAKASADVINKQGGVAGKRVEVTVVDDGGNPTTAVTKLREEISRDKPDLFLNSGPSQIAAATLPILKQQKVLSFNISPIEGSGNPARYPLNFDLGSATAAYASSIAGHAKTSGYRTIGVLYGNSSSGVDFAEASKVVTPNFGVSIVSEEKYETSALDMTPQLQAIQAKKPDALVIDGYGPSVGYLLKGVEKLGWDVPIIADVAVSATGLVYTPPPAGLLGTPAVRNLKLEMQASAVYDPNDDRAREAVDAMKQLGPIPSTLINAQNYDAIWLIAAAARKAGGANDPQALAKAMEDPAVQQEAKPAIWRKRGYRVDSHVSDPGSDGYKFISPSPVRDGQMYPGG